MTGMKDLPAACSLTHQLKQLTGDGRPVSLDVCRALAAVISFNQHDCLIASLFSTVNQYLLSFLF